MKRRYYFLFITIICLIGIAIGLYFSGFLFNNQRIIPPSSSIKWEYLDGNISVGNITEANLVILNLTELMKKIPGIENIQYEIFVSKDSGQQVIDYYTSILEKEGYSYHDEYSGFGTYEYTNIYYYTFIKGLNCVVIYISEYNQHTWICYSTGDVIHYKQIFDYMISHNILS